MNCAPGDNPWLSNLLVSFTIDGLVLHGHGIPVKLPNPELFVVQKLIALNQKPNHGQTNLRDITQGSEAIFALSDLGSTARLTSAVSGLAPSYPALLAGIDLLPSAARRIVGDLKPRNPTPK